MINSKFHALTEKYFCLTLPETSKTKDMDFVMYSGCDDNILPFMAAGGKGVISVLSNVLPMETQAMAKAALDGDFDTAADLQIKLLPLIQALFCEVNPIPVKAAMAMCGFDCGVCRLPLTSLSQEHEVLLKRVLSGF